jgi:hypothetical protein
MRILLHKVDDERHDLEIVREDGRRERANGLESKSLLVHDLLHFAVESEAGLDGGFWGLVGSGRTLVAMNDRTGATMAEAGEDLLLIEQIVGALSNAVKGLTAARMMEGFRNFARARGAPLPAWLDEAFIVRVQERMRRLLGHWRATPRAGTMEIAWFGTRPDLLNENDQ